MEMTFGRENRFADPFFLMHADTKGVSAMGSGVNKGTAEFRIPIGKSIVGDSSVGGGPGVNRKRGEGAVNPGAGILDVSFLGGPYLKKTANRLCVCL